MLSKEFPGGILVLTGANSAVGLRSMPVRYLFLDEVDALPPDVQDKLVRALDTSGLDHARRQRRLSLQAIGDALTAAHITPGVLEPYVVLGPALFVDRLQDATSLFGIQADPAPRRESGGGFQLAAQEGHDAVRLVLHARAR